MGRKLYESGPSHGGSSEEAGLEEGANTRFVLTIGAAGGPTPEIASALIASGASAPPAVSATAVSGAVPLRAPTAAQAQHVRPALRDTSGANRYGPPPTGRIPRSVMVQTSLAPASLDAHGAGRCNNERHFR